MGFMRKNEKILTQNEKAAGTGFCFGVRRAITALEKVAGEQGMIETLGAVVHNQQVLQRLAELVSVWAGTIDDVKGNTAPSARMVSGRMSPQKSARRHLKIVGYYMPFRASRPIGRPTVVQRGIFRHR